MVSSERAALFINIDAMSANIDMVAAKNPGKGIMAVVKADAYGLGAREIAGYLSLKDNITGFGVATADEGIALRSAGIKKPIFILSLSFKEEYEDIIKYELTPCIVAIEDAKALSDVARRVNVNVGVDIKIDTGMGRIGFTPTRESAYKIGDIFKMPNLVPSGIFTHFPCADDSDLRQTQLSYDRFTDVIDVLRVMGVDFPYVHCQNSAASLCLDAPLANMVRCGIVIYGVGPFDDGRFAEDIRDVVSLKSHISFIKDVPENTPISYGATFITGRPSRIATIPIGYADGIPRDLSGRGYVLIRGKRAPITGRVCMDQMMVDVTDISDVRRFDEVTILGTDGTESISIADFSAMSGRFTYEVLTCLGNRLKRIYERN